MRLYKIKNWAFLLHILLHGVLLYACMTHSAVLCSIPIAHEQLLCFWRIYTAKPYCYRIIFKRFVLKWFYRNGSTWYQTKRTPGSHQFSQLSIEYSMVYMNCDWNIDNNAQQIISIGTEVPLKWFTALSSIDVSWYRIPVKTEIINGFCHKTIEYHETLSS